MFTISDNLSKKPPPSGTTSPALDRGLKIMRLLNSGEPMTLEAITRRAQYPRASVARLLRTLHASGMLTRDGNRGAYQALFRLVPIDSGGEAFSKRVRAGLTSLAERTDRTAEWYVPGEEGMIMVERRYGATREIRILADVGFVRKWETELEAVAAVALAHFPGRVRRFDRFKSYDAESNQITLSAEAARRRIEDAAAKGHVVDEVYNKNGVRRAAAIVFGSDGEPAGVVALTEGYTPTADKERAETVAALVEETTAISKAP